MWPIKDWGNAEYGGGKVVGGNAEGWTPLGPKLIGGSEPGGEHFNTFFLTPQFNRERENQVKEHLQCLAKLSILLKQK